MCHVRLKIRGVNHMHIGRVDQRKETIEINQNKYPIRDLSLDVPISGTVYGTLLNYKGAYEALEPLMGEAPYQAPPKAPILYIKPANTFISSGLPIPMPTDAAELEVGACLGIVFGKTAKQVKKAEALDYVKGYTVVNDISIPHESVHRPAVKQKARDGFCPIGPWLTDKQAIRNPNQLQIRVLINGEVKQENNTRNLIRSIEELVDDVTAFMTLYAGDVLLVGVPEHAPLAKENDRVTIEIEGVGTLENTLKQETEFI